MVSKTAMRFFGVRTLEATDFMRGLQEVYDRFYLGKKPRKDYSELTWQELRAEAKKANIEGYTKMKRAEIEEALNDN